MKKRIIALVLVLCLALTLCACGGSGDGEKQEASGNKTVVIGVYEPLSGDNGAGGKQEVLGMQYANYKFPTVEINGETYDVKLEISDN